MSPGEVGAARHRDECGLWGPLGFSGCGLRVGWAEDPTGGQFQYRPEGVGEGDPTSACCSKGPFLPCSWSSMAAAFYGAGVPSPPLPGLQLYC